MFAKGRKENLAFDTFFGDSKDTIRMKFVSCFDIIVINDTLLRHTGVVKVPNFLSVIIIRQQRCAAFF